MWWSEARCSCANEEDGCRGGAAAWCRDGGDARNKMEVEDGATVVAGEIGSCSCRGGWS